MIKPASNNTDPKTSLFFPYLSFPYSRAVFLGFVTFFVGCVVARAPQLYLEKIGSVELPFRLDAIKLILISPIASLILAFLLWRLASRVRDPYHWRSIELATVRFIVFLLGGSFVFMLAQFFLILAPEGQCSSRPSFYILWQYSPGALKINHCMSSAGDINNTAFYYLDPMILHGWINIVLVVAAIVLVVLSWREWRSKRSM